MSGSLSIDFPIAVFGDASTGVWGLVVGGSDPQLALGALPGGEATAFAPASLSAPAATGDWELAADGTSLRLAAATASASTDSAEPGLSLCHMTGSVRLGDREHAVDCTGARRWSSGNGAQGSLRMLAAWFPDSRSVAFSAARPERVQGHDHDVISALLGGETAQVSLFDPRLSTTYDAAGVPFRVGVELWLGESEEGDLHPRRIGGETLGLGVALTGDGFALGGYALRCHDSRSDDGLGVFVIVGPR
jgi:hypothetical protein